METSYSPVQYVYREVIEDEIEKGTSGKVFYFSGPKTVDSTEGKITKMEEVNGKGIFIHLDNGSLIRIDNIVTLFGKPGAAFDEYDSFANACLDCMGGYEKEDLE